MNLVASRGGRSLALAVLGLAVFEALLPLALTLLNAVKTTAEINADPLALPATIRWNNFSRAWIDAALGPSLLHSAEVA
ncbi:MAG: carbohydrate ABC transporter permease, partial [Reyranellales bacterium]